MKKLKYFVLFLLLIYLSWYCSAFSYYYNKALKFEDKEMDVDIKLKTQIKYYTKAIKKWIRYNGVKNKMIVYQERGRCYQVLGLRCNNLLERVDNSDKSIADFSEALKFVNSNNKDAGLLYYYIGSSYCIKKDFSSGVKNFEKALQLDHQLFMANYYLGAYYHLHKKNYDLAIENYTKAIDSAKQKEIEKWNLSSFYRARAKTYELKGNKTKAKQDYDMAQSVILLQMP